MNEWISVKERLPNEEDDVLVLVRNIEHYGIHKEERSIYRDVFVGWRADDEWATAYCHGFQYLKKEAENYPDEEYEVTHWMPLPKPPAEEDQPEAEEKLRELDGKGVGSMKWNAISDGLPPMGVPLIVTVKDNLEHGQNKILCPAYYERKRENNGYHFNWRYGDMIYDLLPDVSEVIAWAEFPTPFEGIQACRAVEAPEAEGYYEQEIRDRVVEELSDRICSHFADWQYTEDARG